MSTRAGTTVLTALTTVVAVALLSIGFSGVSSATPGGGLSLADSTTSPAPGSKVTLVA